MKKIIICLLFTNIAYANNFTQGHIENLKKKKEISFGDLLHENPGCLENSLCSKTNGLKVLAWKKLEDKPKSEIEKFRVKTGIPVQILIYGRDTKTLDPIIYTSRCNSHNPKDTNEKIFKSIMFLRNNPLSQKIVFPTLINHENEMKYQIPYGEQPLFIKNKKVFLVGDFEDINYTISISTSGKWRIENTPQSLITMAIDKKENTECEKKIIKDSFFTGSYCTKIWDEDQKRLVTLEQSWSCP